MKKRIFLFVCLVLGFQILMVAPKVDAQSWNQLIVSPTHVVLDVGEIQDVNVYGTGGEALNITSNTNTNVVQVNVIDNNSVRVRGLSFGSATITLSTFEKSGTLYVAVIDQKDLRFVTNTLPNATVNEFYSQKIEVAGGDYPYDYSIVSGSLPDQMTLSNDGWIQGTPGYVQKYNFDVRVIDNDGVRITRTFSINVTEGYGGGQQERYRYRHGQLILENGTIYSIYCDQKYGFTNMETFQGMGYRLSNVERGYWTNLPQANQVVSSPNMAHPWGTWVIDGKTVYFVHEKGLIPITTYSIFVNNLGQDRMLVPMNLQDRQRTQLSFMENNDLRLMHQYKNQYIIRAKVGETFNIFQRANPSTGYQWELNYDNDYLRLQNRVFNADSTQIGSAGTEQFQFKALNQGQVALTFQYRRAWETESPMQLKSYLVGID